MMDNLADRPFGKIQKDPTGKTEHAVAKLSKATDWANDLQSLLTPRESVFLHVFA